MSDGKTGDGRVRGVAHVPGRHFVSPFNFLPEVTAEYEIPQPLGLIDSTIRKVIYTAGIRPTHEDLLAICAILDDLGVGEESLNIWWHGAEQPNRQEFEAMRTVAGGGFRFKVNVFTDTMLGDGTAPMPRMKQTIDILADNGIRLINPGLIQAPDAEAAKRQRDEMFEMAAYAKAAGMEWNATIANCGRRDFEALVALTNTAIEAGVRRLDLMDSTSALSPQAMTHFVRTYRRRMTRPTPMTMHTHDDFGMSAAGTIAAVIAGASPDVALNGVSYRSGFAALEEVVLALDVLYGADTGIRIDRLQEASDRLARIMGMPVPPLKPVVGFHQFLREGAGEAAKILQGNSDADFAAMGSSVAPSLTGASFHWAWASHGGPAMARTIADALGVTLDDDQVARVVERLEGQVAASTHYPKWVLAETVEATIREVAGR